MDTSDQIAERLERIERLLKDPTRQILDPNRAYSDAEVCALLGGISRTTLWRIRNAGLLDTVQLFPGGTQRTTGKQIADYLAGRERDADVLGFTGTGRKRNAA